MPHTAANHPGAHYDQVSHAWRYLMGESFHYGYFETSDQSLDSATESLTREMAKRGQIGAGHRVLDVGCGIGGPALYLAETFDCRVTGISTSDVGIASANEKASESGRREQLAFHVRDGMQNEFEDAAFDRAWVMESSHLMPDKAKMLLDSARVLRPGGRLVLCDIIVHRDLQIGEVLERAREFDLLRKVFGRAKMATLDSYQAWCLEAGLAIDHVEDISRQTAPTFSRWEQNAKRFREPVIELIGEQPWVDFANACSTLEKLWSEEVLGYGMLSAEKIRWIR